MKHFPEELHSWLRLHGLTWHLRGMWSTPWTARAGIWSHEEQNCPCTWTGGIGKVPCLTPATLSHCPKVILSHSRGFHLRIKTCLSRGPGHRCLILASHCPPRKAGERSEGLKDSWAWPHASRPSQRAEAQTYRSSRILYFRKTPEYQNYMTALGFDSWWGSVWDPNQDNHSFN